MIIPLILIVVSVSISVIGITYICTHTEEYGTRSIYVLIILIYLFDQALYFTMINFSTGKIFSSSRISLMHWKIALIVRIISLMVLSMIHTFALEYRKIKYIPLVVYSFIGSIIFTLVLSGDSVSINTYQDHNLFTINNPVLLTHIVFFNITVMIFAWAFQIMNFSEIRNERLAKMFTLLILHFIFIIITYIIYISTQNILSLHLHIYSCIIGAFIILYMTIRIPDLFVLLTNKIYDFIIFHKSGILLYSYNFDTREETDESVLKGTILIGINHILASFLNKKDQLNLIKMKNRDIILEYDNEFGYAILLITNQKNPIITSAVQRFMKSFTENNRENLTKLLDFSLLVDVSVFRNAMDLINEYFHPYLTNN